MSQLHTFAKSVIVSLAIVGSVGGILNSSANCQAQSDRDFSSISLPPPPPIKGVKSGSSNVTIEPPPPPLPNESPTVSAPPPPPAPEYCYVGTWKVTDMSQYWLPIVQNFARGKLTTKPNEGNAQITFTKDGFSVFEARHFEQKYQLKSARQSDRINEYGLTIGGRATAEYKETEDKKLSFSEANYRRLRSQLNLGEDFNVTGEKLLFNLYGQEGEKSTTLPYDCLDRDTIVIKLPAPKTKKLIALKLTRVR